MSDRLAPGKGDLQGKVRLSEKLNLETAEIAWKDLQTFFANGSVVYVSNKLDLITVAEQLAADNKVMFEEWMSSNLVSQVSDQQALQWYETDATLWAVVIKPWVLVQES